MQNRRYFLKRHDEGFDLEHEITPIPEPGAGEVLVRMRAVSINRRDVMIRNLTYNVPAAADRFTPLSDGAGEVVAVGAGVTSVKAGDRVASTFFQDWPDGRISLPALMSSLGAGGQGTLADYVTLKETGVVPLPAGWSFEEGAALPCAAVTAWSALVRLGRMEPGDTVLVIGTGGVALFVLQLAAGFGCPSVVLSGSDEKLERAKAMGATHMVNYKTHPEWHTQVRELTGGRGVDQAPELGGAGTLPHTLASMALGGHVALIGALAGGGAQIPSRSLQMAALRLSTVTVGSRADHAAVQGFMVEHGLKPVIDHVYAADAAEAAYGRLEQGAFGKVVVTL